MAWTNTTLRERENASIAEFLEEHSGLLSGDVLDFGAGRQPYRRLVERAGGDYTPYDRIDFPGSVAHTTIGPNFPLDEKWDAIICTQVLQYVIKPTALVGRFWHALNEGGHLLLTGPTNWPEVEKEDLWRFTGTGIQKLLDFSGFSEVEVRPRAILTVNDIRFSLGYGAVAKQ